MRNEPTTTVRTEWGVRSIDPADGKHQYEGPWTSGHAANYARRYNKNNPDVHATVISRTVTTITTEWS